MKIKDFKEYISKLPDDYDIYVRYGDSGQVSDIEAEFVCDDENLGEFYLLCSNGRNIQATGMDGD